MKIKKTDRRSLRTRKMLSDSLVYTLKRKRYENISIQDILEQANVGRSTFYTHFYDKEDLLISSFEHILDSFIHPQKADNKNSAYALPSLSLFKHAQEYHSLYIALVHGGCAELVLKNAHTHLYQKVEEYLLSVKESSNIPIPILADYLVGTLINLLKWWLENYMPLKPEEMNQIYHQLIASNIQT